MLNFITQIFKRKLKFYYCTFEITVNANHKIDGFRTRSSKNGAKYIIKHLLQSLLDQYPNAIVSILSCVEIDEETCLRIKELNDTINSL
jgi:hypothetical protein